MTETAGFQLSDEPGLSKDNATTFDKALDWSRLQPFYTTSESSSKKIEISLAARFTKTEVEFARTGEAGGMKPIGVPFAEVLTAVMSSQLRSPTLVVSVRALAAQRNQNG